MSPRLVAHPVGFFGRRYALSTDGNEPVIVEFGSFSRRVLFAADGETWRMRLGRWRGRFTLERERDGYSLAEARPRRWFSFTYDLALADRRLTLVPRGFWGRRWELLHGDRSIGEARVTGFLGRSVEAVLPDSLPGAVGIFVVLTLIAIQRRRAAAAAAAG